MTDRPAGLPDLTFRTEAHGDEPGIRAVVEAAFGEQVVADLVDTLRASPDWLDLSFVAETAPTADERRIVGHVLFTRSLLDAPARLVDVLVLSPLSVAPDHQGRGIGSALVRHGLDRLATRPEPLLFVEGAPGYYGRFGFEPGEELGFRRPSLRIPPAAFQVLRRPGHEPWMTGTLVYGRAFWDLDCVGLREPG